MAINISFVSDISQITRDMSTLGDRLDSAVDDLEQLGRAGDDAADGLDDAAKAGRDLDQISDAADDAARSLDDTAKAGRDLDEIGDAGKDAAAGLDDASHAAEDTERALKDAGDAGETMGKGIRDAGDDVERMTKDVTSDVDLMSKDVQKAFDTMNDEARKSTSGIRDTAKKDMGDAASSTETFRDEARSNFSETLSSFDGSLEGIVDGLQGTFGGVAADLGPAGMLGAGVVAAGLGMGMAYAEKVGEGINEKGDIAAALAEEIREAGGAIDDIDFTARMDEWGSAIQDTRETWELWQDEARTGFQDIAKLSEDGVVAYEKMFRGVTGTAEEAQLALEEINRRLEENRANTEGWLADPVEMNKQGAALRDLKGQIEDNIDVQEQATESEELRARAIGVTTDELSSQIDAQEELSSILSDSIESELDYLDTLDEVNATLEENGKTTNKATAEGRENIRALIDLKNASFDYASAQIDAGESTATVSGELRAQRTAFIDAAEAAGYSNAEARELADAYGLIPDQIITDVQAKGTDEAKRQLNDVADGPYDATIKAKSSGTATVESEFRRLTRPRYGTVTIRTVGASSTASFGRNKPYAVAPW